jgi:hypothetical protein
MAAGFEGYAVDYRRNTTTYYLAESGDCVVLENHTSAGAVAPEFNASGVEKQVRRAQANEPGYTYLSFCEAVKAMAAPAISSPSPDAAWCISGARRRPMWSIFRNEAGSALPKSLIAQTNAHDRPALKRGHLEASPFQRQFLQRACPMIATGETRDHLSQCEPDVGEWRPSVTLPRGFDSAPQRRTDVAGRAGKGHDLG